MTREATPYSTIKIFAHTDKLEAIRRGERVAPVYIRIKPTNACNHKCDYCHYASGKYLDLEGAEPQNHIPYDKMMEIVNDLGDMGVRAVTFSGGGEPLVYPYILPAMKGLLERNVEISVITNGSRLNGEIADVLTQAKWVRISCDAADGKLYAANRQIPETAFAEVCANIERFAKIKPADCELGINFVITRENADQVYGAGKLFRDLGVNHIKYAARITTDVHGYHASTKAHVIEQLHRVTAELARPGFSIINKYEEDFSLSASFQRGYRFCAIKEIVTVIAADCKVYYCHDKAYLKNGIVGDLKEKSFKEVWFSPETIQKVQCFDAEKECAHHCVYDDRNILINSFLSLNRNHVNFI
ncbi:radical SAM protein [Heliobacterium gestii]|uniref:Radical SAM protein n=1 Tax=Heliomicrobium gestii TaxID=2699 RepID=A0A845L8S3_HELGE|nr:radical SAM protein [Heliomicrobium gestii]MBM7866688.1 MoaA/NifB/PqqE/SkfB family radical SAM enzyme [Heliomicrobium gestii]MZP43032.1 radical SAM protein [Heliomicrobium gestii]